MKRALLTNGLENGGALVGSDLLVSVVVDDEPRYVLDDASNRRNVAFTILEDDANLGSGNVKSPEALSVSFDEAGNSFEDIFVSDWEIVDEVHKDVVDVGVSLRGTDEFESVQDVGDETIHFGDEVLGGIDAPSNAARTNESSNKAPTIKLILPRNTVIHVELLALGEQRSEVVV